MYNAKFLLSFGLGWCMGKCFKAPNSRRRAASIAASIMDAPGCYYAFPYIAKALFPRYSPSGIHPIKSIENIAHDIPIVIIHSKEDDCLPYSDACALYYGLRSQGHENVYLISCEGDMHIHLRQSFHVCGILMQHSVFPPVKGSMLPTLFVFDKEKADVQPEIEQYRDAYDELYSRELNHECLPPLSCTVAACITCLESYQTVADCCTEHASIADCCAEQSMDMCSGLLSWFALN